MIKWSITEVARDEWWAVDTSTGVAYAVPAVSGEQLWREANVGVPLPVALDSLSTGRNQHEGRMIDLRFAGVTARYVVEDERTLAWLASQFAAATPTLRCLPDLVVKISADADLDRLHRAVPNQRPGVWARRPGEAQWTAADHDLPILPPIQNTSLGAQFAALHAALVLTDNTATIVAGPQKSGKTTAAIVSQDVGLGVPATDELVLLGRTGMVYGVPLPLRIRGQEGRRTEPMPSSAVLKRQPCRATHLVLLNEVSEAPCLTAIASATAAFAGLSKHVRPLALSLGHAAQLALELVAYASVWRLACRPWPYLRQDLEAGLQKLAEVKTS